MGGTGPGHKSERARQARLVNMAKARAARKREPLRWRSGLESRIIEQLVWQWWLESSGEWLVASGWPAYAKAPVGGVGRRGGRIHPKASPRRSGVSYMGPAYADVSSGKGRAGLKPAPTDASLRGDSAGVPAPFSKDALGKATRGPAYAKASAGKPDYAQATLGMRASAGKAWAKLRVARLLGVSHTWVNKLVKRFEADPDRMRRRMAAFAPATLEKLERAREETRRQRELGWLRGPIRMRRVKWTREGKTQRGILWTQSEKRRREGKAKGRARVPDAELPAWARGL